MTVAMEVRHDAGADLLSVNTSFSPWGVRALASKDFANFLSSCPYQN
jgi:hypothetical protein